MISEKDEHEASAPERVPIHYVKSSAYRTIHADGIWGGVTPRGLISVTFFAERYPIPRQLVHRVEDGRIAEEIQDERVTRDGIVREVDATVAMDIEMARSLHQWLSRNIALHESMSAQRSPSTPEAEDL